MTTFKKSILTVTAALLPAMGLWADNVAKVGDTEYATLTEAVNAITSENQTIVLLTDLTETLTVNKGFVFDLNNHGISGLTIEGGNVVVTDNSSEKGGYIKKTSGYAVYVKGGSVEVKGGTISGLTYGIFAAANTTTTISGGTVTTTAPSYKNASGNTATSIAFYTNGTATLNGGVITSGGIVVRTGTTGVVTQNGTTITGTGTYGVYNAGAYTMEDATLSSAKYPFIATGGTISVNGGKVSGTKIYMKTANASPTFKVNGGKFSMRDTDVLLALGNDYTLTTEKDEEGYYSVAQREVMAKIGDTEYRSLNAAIEAAQNNDVITLTRDVTDGSGILIADGTAKNITIDFANHTYTVLGPGVGSTNTLTQAIHLSTGSTCKMTNGSISVAEDASGISMMMQNYSDLTLDKMTIDCSKIKAGTYGTYTGDYAFWSNRPIPVFNFNRGTSSITNSTIIFSEDEPYGIMIGSTANGVTSLALGEGVVVNGNVSTTSSGANVNITGGTYKGTISDFDRGGKIAISGGTFSTPVDLAYCADGYIPQKNADGTYSVKQGSSALLRDGEAYAITEEKQVDVATYKRSFGEERVNKFQAWFVPFDYKITEEDAKKFKFYKVNFIANSAEPGESSETTDNFWIFLSDMAAGEKLVANKPYIFKPLEESTNYEFTTENAMMKAPANDSRLSCSTTTVNYDFYGVYDSAVPSAENPFYYMNIDGQISLGSDGEKVKVGSYRWIIKVAAKDGTSADYARTFVFVEPGDNTATGIRSLTGEATAEAYYTIGGKQTSVPVKGINIVRTADGKMKKVVMK